MRTNVLLHDEVKTARRERNSVAVKTGTSQRGMFLSDTGRRISLKALTKDGNAFQTRASATGKELSLIVVDRRICMFAACAQVVFLIPTGKCPRRQRTFRQADVGDVDAGWRRRRPDVDGGGPVCERSGVAHEPPNL